jgi:hypothetical protein
MLLESVRVLNAGSHLGGPYMNWSHGKSHLTSLYQSESADTSTVE